MTRLTLVAGQVGARQNFWFNLTDDMLDLRRGTMAIPSELAKNRREHRIYMTRLEVALLAEQMVVRPADVSLVFPTATGKRWTANRFRERVWYWSLGKSRECGSRQPLDEETQSATSTAAANSTPAVSGPDTLHGVSAEPALPPPTSLGLSEGPC